MEPEASVWDNIITVYSPGGGTGKSEIAAHIAYILANRGKKVWLIDANLFTPSLDIIYNINYDNCDTLNEFLLNDGLSQIPVRDISHLTKHHSNGRLYLTPCIRNDAERRSLTETALIENENICEKIPGAIYQGLGTEIDYLIVDTHPGFERINQAWLAITNYLLVVSRITAVDIENLGMLLKEKNLIDIRKKLIVFNNVYIDEGRNAYRTMKNNEMQEKFLYYLNNPSAITGVRPEEDNSVEIFNHPIPYSEALAAFPKEKGLYMLSHTMSDFACIMESLAEKIEYTVANQ